jgi:cytidylate kinase
MLHSGYNLNRYVQTWDTNTHDLVVSAASLENRIENLVKRGWLREVAIRAIEKSDHERGSFIKYAFRVDWDDPELYDLVLNMDHLTIDFAVDTVLHIAKSEEIKARSMDAMKSLEMMGFARRAEDAFGRMVCWSRL